MNLVDLPGRHLRALLDLLTPTWHGEEVRLDGYRSLGEPDLVHPLFIDENWDFGRSDNRLDIYEPRLTYIRKLIESLLSLVEFEYHNEPIRMDGFRLKKPAQWLRPGGGASDILAQAATRCNLRCRFCYNLGSPPAFQTIPGQAEEEFREILTRIACYVPGSKLGFFPDAGSPCEMLTHPNILEILAALRKKTAEVLRIPTNGAQLTPEIITDPGAIPAFVCRYLFEQQFCRPATLADERPSPGNGPGRTGGPPIGPNPLFGGHCPLAFSFG